jgi:hypothetical protein
MRWVAALLTLVFLPLYGCDGGGDDSSGGADGSLTCETLSFVANGASPVGKWKAVDTCFTETENPPEPWCEDYYFSEHVIELDTEVEYRDNGVVTGYGSIKVKYTDNWGPSCLDDLGETCSEEASMLLATWYNASSTCVESGTHCICNTTKEFQDGGWTGFWKIEGDQLKLDYYGLGNWVDGGLIMVDHGTMVIESIGDYGTSHNIYYRQHDDSAGGGGGGLGITCDNLDFADNSESPVGEWDLVDLCVTATANPMEDQCPDVVFTMFMVDADIVVEYRNDGTMLEFGYMTLGQGFDMATSCLEDDGATCDDMNTYFADQSKFESASCVVNIDRCVCDIVTKPILQFRDIEWQVKEGLLSTTSLGEWEEGEYYMVDAGNLVIETVAEYSTFYNVYRRR